MTGLATKAIRDFWQERTRTFLVILATALGISGFAAVLSSYAVLTRALNEGYLATNPASATLLTDAVDDQLLATVRSSPQIADAEPRRVLTGRIKAGPARWQNLTLFVVKDFIQMRISTLQHERGAWPPAPGEILIERDAFQVARTRMGDVVTVRTSGGKDHKLTVSGSVHDVGQAQARMENIVYGYIGFETLKELGEQPYLDQLKILVRENRFDEAHVRAVTEDTRKLIESEGHPVRRIDVPKPGKHPHADINGLLLLVLAGFGLFVLILSGVLVMNLMSALMASQVRQIAVMKVIGGTRRQIARIYLTQAIFIGVAAIVVALLPGVLGCRWLCRSMAVFLNFDINSFAAPAWVYLCVVAVGLVVPLLAAAMPVWKGAGISARDALTDFGVFGSHFGRGQLERLLSERETLGRPLAYAVRNTLRRRTRTLLTLLTLTAAGLFFIAGLNLRASMMGTLDRLFAAKKFDLALGLGAMHPFEKVERAIRNTPGIVRAEGWITTEGTLPAHDATAGASAAAGGPAGASGHGRHQPLASTGDRFTVIALPPKTDLLKLDILSGRNLQNGDDDALVINTALLAKAPQMRLGQMVSLRLGHVKAALRLVGIAREPFSPPVAYIPRSYIEQHGGHGGMTNAVRLVLENTNPDSLERLKASLDEHLEEQGVRALTSLSTVESRYGFDQHMVMIYVALVIMSCVIGAVGGLGLMTTLSLNILERRREIGILRAIGATPRQVSLLLISEAEVIGLMSWALATIAGWILTKGLGAYLARATLGTLDSTVDLRGIWIWLGVSMVLAAASGVLPARRAARLVVREALAYE